MKPFRLRIFGVAAYFLANAFTHTATAVNLQVTSLYEMKSACTGPMPAPVQVTASILASGCAASTTCAANGDGLFPSTVCSATDGTDGGGSAFITTDLPKLFGAVPYIVVQSYTAGGGCATPGDITSITAYVSDGLCHKTAAAASYTATRDFSSKATELKTYTSADCSGTATTWTVTGSLATSNACGASTVLADKKLFDGGKFLYVKSTTSYDSKADSCKPTGLAMHATATTSDITTTTTCTASTTCIGANAPYTGTTCSSLYSYEADMATAFGSNPYLVVETYTAGQSCDPLQLTQINTYMADGECHLAAGVIYIATRASDGAVSVKTYNQADCSDSGTSILAVNGVDATANACTADKKIYGTGKTLYLTSTLSSESNTGSCVAPTFGPILATTTNVGSVGGINCVTAASCTLTAGLYTGTVCSSPYTYKMTDIPTAFGSSPYVIVEKYTPGLSCAVNELTSINTYLADGLCHKTAAQVSYIATRAADGTSSVKTYGTPDCTGSTTAAATVAATAAQATGNKCAAGTDGILDTKIYGKGQTLYLTSTLSYDLSTDNCKSPGLAMQATTSSVAVTSTCTPSTTCTGTAAPFTGTLCSSPYSYKMSDIPTAFGTNPYVIVEKYNAGKNCDGSELASIDTYLADGLCHQTASGVNYLATRLADQTANVKTYSTTDCSGAVATTLAVTAAQATGNTCTATNGIVDTKIYGKGKTWFLTSTLTYETSDNCMAAGFSTKAITTSVTAATANALTTSCSPTTQSSSCANPVAGVYTGTMCSSAYSYKVKDIPAAFGSNPYIVVESYSGSANCDGTDLTGIETYLADGLCHKTAASVSYIASRAADGSAVINTYANADCSGSSPTLYLDASAAQVSGNTCTSTNGIANKKIFGAGVTPVYLSSAMKFDTNVGTCVPTTVTPTSMATTVATSSTSCTATSVCAGTADPYTGTSCSIYSTFQADVLKFYGTKPYVIVESYTAGKSCDGSKLSGMTTYLADGLCHKTATSAGYIASRFVDGSAVVKVYGTGDCTGSPTSTAVDVTAAQVKGNTCVSDKKYYGNGVTPLYLSSALGFDANTGSCVSPAIPTSVTTTVAASSTSCVATTACTGAADPYTGTSCSTYSTFQADVLKLFGSQPYVIVESYTAAKSCDGSKLSGIASYLADGLCHKTAASATYIATRAADGSAVIKTYVTADCTGAATTLLDASASQVKGNKCATGTDGIVDKKVYGAGVTPVYLTLAMGFDTSTGSCVSPAIPTFVTSTVAASSTSCVATTACTGAAVPYTGTACSSYSTYQADLLKMFGTQPYVIVESYTAGKSCDGTKLSGISAYLADGLCHKTGASTSYIATRAADGSAVVNTYTTAGCTGPTTTATTVTVTAAQATGNKCATGVDGVVDKKIYGAGKTLYLTSILSYDSNTDSCKSPGLAIRATTTSVAVANSCTASTTCTGTAAPYTGTLCSSTFSYKSSDIPTAFGSNAYVIVEKYNAGKSCAGSELASVDTYLADGLCHKTAAQASFIATRAADGTSSVKTYGTPDCTGSTTAATTLAVTAAQATGNKCAAGTDGILDTKIYGKGQTLYLTSTLSYDLITDNCKSPGLAMQATTSSVAVTSTCTPSTTCTGTAAPFTGTLCSSPYSYKMSDIPTAFGTNPYVIVEKYNAGKNCDGSELASIDTYLADGLCHKPASGTTYIATRSADGTAQINTFTSADCSGTASTTLAVTAAQATGNTCTATNGIVDTKIYGKGKTLYLTSTLSYDSNADSCKSPGLAILATTSSVAATSSCTASSACTGTAAPYTGTLCSSAYSYKTSDIPAAFGSNPYVVVESYSASCDGTDLTGITTYMADGSCHKTAASASYIASRAADGSAVVKTYAAADCTGAATTLLDATAAQVKGNKCAAGTDGIAGKKVYGTGVTPMYLSSALKFDTTTGACVSPPAVPTSVTSTVVASSTSCVATTACTGTADPYTGTSCSINSTYQADVLKMFGTKPYVIVESYTAGKSCDGTKLSTIATYLADGLCHKTAATATYIATRAADGSAVVKTYATADCTGTATTLLDATASQVKGNKCATGTDGIVDKKVYGAGVTPVYLTLALGFDTSTGSCVSPVVPTSVTTTVAASSSSCVATTACTGTADPYTGTSCSTYSTFQADVLKLFGTKPYVIVESYTPGTSCSGSKLSGMAIYLADGACHKTAATATYIATRAADGSAVVKTYATADCTGTATTLLDATASQVKGNKCATGTDGIVDKKVYGAGVTPVYLTLALGFDTSTGSCVSPVVPTSVTTTVAASSSSCVATTACTGTADPYTGTSCSTYSTFQADVLKLFGTKPYVIVESYTAGKSCDGTKLSGMMIYLADGRCHKIGPAASYSANRMADGSANVKTYATAACSGTVTPMIVTKEQATGNSCAAGTTGIVDKKIYGSGNTATLYSAVVAFDDKTCTTPAQMTVSGVLACTPATCTVTGDRSVSGACADDYFVQASTVFASQPYLVVELYAENTCATKQGVMVYLLDGACHTSLDGASSFQATLSSSGEGSIQQYTGTGCTSSTPQTVPLALGQLTSHACTGGQMFYAYNVLATDPPATNPPPTSTPTPTPVTTASTGSGTSGAVFGPVLSMLVIVVLGGTVALLL